jgi:hypothetical protein
MTSNFLELIFCRRLQAKHVDLVIESSASIIINQSSSHLKSGRHCTFTLLTLSQPQHSGKTHQTENRTRGVSIEINIFHYLSFIMLRLNLTVFLLLAAGTSAFAPPAARTSLAAANPCTTATTESSLVTLFAEESSKKKTGGLDGKMRSKLLSETIAPWRSLRLFLYGSLGSGAFIGGLINGSGAIAGSALPEFNLNTEVRNVQCVVSMDRYSTVHVKKDKRTFGVMLCIHFLSFFL